MGRRLAKGLGILVLGLFGAAALVCLTVPRALRGKASADPEAREILEDLGRRVILPGYRALCTEAESLMSEARRFEREPGEERLRACRKAWADAKRAWNLCEAHFVGPEAKRFLDRKIDPRGLNEEGVEKVIASDAVLDERSVEKLGSNLKGFAALEYLLFDRSALEALTAHPRRRGYLRALSENLEAVAREIRDLWEPTGGNQLGAFPDGRGLEEVFNRLIVFSEFVRDGRLGRPLGVAGAGGSAMPHLVESRRSGRSTQDLLEDLEGIRRVYGDGRGLSKKVRRVSPEIDRAVRNALDSSERNLRSIPRPLDQAVEARDPAALEAFQGLIDLHRRIATDLVGVYGIRVTVLRFDGD